MAIERAKYSVEVSQPPYEVRDYASSVVAIVAVHGSRSEAVNVGFRVLADYIFGNNREKSKIAMTAPVTQVAQRADPAKASVSQGALPTEWVVRFMMPTDYTLRSLPAPGDGRVRFEESVPHRVAAVSFSGFWSDDNLNSHAAGLLQWMSGRGLVPRSAPTYAYYDPPWMPWFMRTIEVLIDIAPPA